MENECEVRCKDETKNSWFKDWLRDNIVLKHGERLFFLGLSNIESCFLLWIAYIYEKHAELLVGVAIGIFVGTAQLFFNKSRGPKHNDKPE